MTALPCLWVLLALAGAEVQVVQPVEVPPGPETAAAAGEEPRSAMEAPRDQRPSEARSADAGEEEAPSAAEALGRAAKLVEEGKATDAVALMEKAVKRFPDQTRVLWALGVLYRDAGEARRAEETLRAAIRADRNNGSAQADLAALLEQRGAYAEALTSANRAVSLLPRDAGVRADRAVIRFRLGQLDGAIQDMRHASRERPNDPELLLNHALIRLARGRNADVKRALDLLRAARRLVPDDERIILTEAIALAAAKRDDQSRRELDRILKGNPRQGWAAFTKGLLAWRATDYTGAEALGRTARKVLPGEFLPQRYALRRFFLKDAKGYLKWLDDRITGRDVRGAAGGTSRPRVAGLRVDGDCNRNGIRRELGGRAEAVDACFREHRGRVGVQMTVSDGEISSVSQGGARVQAEVDACVLDAMKGLRWDEGSCNVQFTWFHPPTRAKSARSATTLPPPRPEVRVPKLKNPRKPLLKRGRKGRSKGSP